MSWCGPASLTFDGAVAIDAPDACASVALEVLDGAPWDGSEGDTRGRPTRVTWTVRLDDGGGQTLAVCRARGEDADGLRDGFDAAVDPATSRCEVYAPGVLGVADGALVAQQALDGAISRVGNGAATRWVVSAEGASDVWETDLDDLRFARITAQPALGIDHDGALVDDDPPVVGVPARGTCFADGCWQVDFDTATTAAGDDAPACDAIVDATGAPSVIYLVRDDGHQADNGLTDAWFAPLPVDTCSMQTQNDTFWSTTLDFDTGIATVTYVGPGDLSAGDAARCRVAFEGPLTVCP